MQQRLLVARLLHFERKIVDFFIGERGGVGLRGVTNEVRSIFAIEVEIPTPVPASQRPNPVGSLTSRQRKNNTPKEPPDFERKLILDRTLCVSVSKHHHRPLVGALARLFLQFQAIACPIVEEDGENNNNNVGFQMAHL